jgi:AcrR family transcriptional regulator
MASSRADSVADAAVAVLADQGMRGLTHRAVDEAAGLPIGSTSNLARTRAALLEMTLIRLASLEAEEYAPFPQASAPADPGGPASPAETLVEAITHGLTTALTTGRPATLARFELALEATRRPELRVLYNRLGRDFQLMVVDLLAQAGSRSPGADARTLVSACEGILFYHLVGAASSQEHDEKELRAKVQQLTSMLTRTD